MNLRYIIADVIIGAKTIKVNWPYIVANLLFPLSLLFIVGVLSQGRLLEYALVGGLISVVAMNGVNAVAYIASLRFDFYYQDLIVTTKTSKMDYMLAHLFGEAVWVAPSVLLFIVLEAWFGLLTLSSLVMTLFVAALVSLATYAIAFWIAGMVKNTRHTPAIGLVLSILMITLPPSFYPYTYLPKNILYVLTLIPTTPGVILAQGIAGITPMQWWMLPVLIIEVMAYVLIAKYLTKWRED